MEIEDLGGEENLELWEAVRKSGAHRKGIFYRVIYALISNPKWERKNINKEIILLMSDIINHMDTEDKLLLTIGHGANAVTPQQSFTKFFSSYDLRHINPTKFKYKFIELYHKKGEEFLNEVRKAEDKNLEVINAFWKNFIVLLEPEIISARYDHNRPHMKVKLFFVSVSQKARRLKRVLLSGINGDN